MKKKSHSFSHVVPEKENIQRLSLDTKLLVNPSGQTEELQQEINLNIPKKTCSKKWLIFGSTILGAGVGLAMMPIFNEEVEHLENYGVDVHGNSTFFAISTINTLIVAGASTGFYFYNYFFNSQKEEAPELNKIQKGALALCKVGGFVGSLIPVGMLWNIELNDQKVEGTHGFDQFIAWATFTSLPLIFFKTLNNFEQISKYIVGKSETVDLSSLGSKITVYGLSGISLIGRGISLTYIFNEFQKQIGIDENVSLPISIITGGVVGNITLGLSEYSNLKKLFQKNVEGSNYNYKQLLLGISSVLEGGWFALPVVSQGLDATKDWNALLKGAIFAPFFLSHMNSESSHLYHSILPETPALEEQNNEIQLLGETHSEILE
jgi:hypothetical protein